MPPHLFGLACILDGRLDVANTKLVQSLTFRSIDRVFLPSLHTDRTNVGPQAVGASRATLIGAARRSTPLYTDRPRPLRTAPWIFRLKSRVSGPEILSPPG